MEAGMLLLLQVNDCNTSLCWSLLQHQMCCNDSNIITTRSLRGVWIFPVAGLAVYACVSLVFYDINVYTSSLGLASCVDNCSMIARRFGRGLHGKVEEGWLRYFLRSG